MAKEKRLGRGLEALLGRVGGPETTGETERLPELSRETEADWLLQQRLASQIPASVDIMLIERNPHQPRREFDEAELDQLAASLQTHGLLQPIVVRKVEGRPDGKRYQIIAGERRFRAAMRAGWSEVPIHCLAVDDREMIELALTENLQRKDLNAIEKATSFANYLEAYGGTHEELARRLGFDRSTVSNLLRLLELPRPLQEAVQKETLTQGHVRALLPLQKQDQIEVAARIQAEGWSVRTTERLVRERIAADGSDADQPDGGNWNLVDRDGQKRPVGPQSEQLAQLEQDFRERLGGAKVKLTQTNDKGKGKLVISFSNHAEFERIYSVICRNGKTAAGS